VLNSAGDRRKLINPLLNKGLQFIVRLVGNRHLVFRCRNQHPLDLARGCPMIYADTIVKEVKGEEKVYRSWESPKKQTILTKNHI
jgi:hypothetical protein